MKITLGAQLLLSCQAISAAILAIDYGTEWTKAALVKPGIPLEIVLTKDTKRKEQSVIAFKDTERLYGGDAANLAARLPSQTYPGLKTLLGQTIDSPDSAFHALTYPANQLTKSTRNAVQLSKSEDELFSAEELVAMQLINMRKNAEAMAGERIRDAVLTVPPFFSQAQRLALLDAAELAGLRTLELINDGLAVALDYAKGRTFNTSQIHIVYDMGAGSTSATVLRFSTKSIKDVGRFNKTVTFLEVLGSGFDTTASGNTMTNRIYQALLSEFDAQHSSKAQQPIAENARATARLLKEATRAKQVLSANNDVMVSVESLHEDIDFRFKLTRSSFEALNSDLSSRAVQPILDALTAAGISTEQVDSLILHGGAARVPFVQQALLKMLPEEKIARNVNADESAVMGAVFRGAGLSGAFRVKEIRLEDRSMEAFLIETPKDVETLFAANTPYGTIKNITLSTTEDDFEFGLLYGPRHDSPNTRFSTVKTQGLKNATLQLVKDHGCKTPELTISILLDNSGVVRVESVTAHCDIIERRGVADTVKGWFGGKDADNEGATESSEGDADSPKTEEETKASRKVITLSSSVSLEGFQSIGQAELQRSLEKIRVYENHDSDRIARETARNSLEAYIYKLRDQLDSESFLEASTASEQTELRTLSAGANEWMYGEGEHATTQDLVSKRREMSRIADAVLFRKSEAATRDDKVEKLKKQIDTTRQFIKSQMKNIDDYDAKKEAIELRASKVSAPAKSGVPDESPELAEQAQPEDELTDDDDLMEPLYAKRDLLDLNEKVDNADRWLQETTKEQAGLAITDDPILLGKDLMDKTSKLSDQLLTILTKASYRQQSKPKPKPRAKTSSKPQTKASTPTKSPADTPNDATTESAAEQQPVEQTSKESEDAAEDIVQEDVVDPTAPKDEL